MKHYLISKSRKPHEVDSATIEQLASMLNAEPLCVYFLAMPNTRRGIYDFSLIQGSKLLFTHNKVTLFEATLHVQKQTGLALHHAETLLKASPESTLIILPA